MSRRSANATPWRGCQVGLEDTFQPDAAWVFRLGLGESLAAKFLGFWPAVALALSLFLRLNLFGYSSPIEITLIRDNLLSLNLDDGSSLQGEGNPIGSRYHRCA